MKVMIRAIILTVLLVAMGTPSAMALPHDTYICGNCHIPGVPIDYSIGYFNTCTNCHSPGAVNGAKLRWFQPNDASNIFNSVTTARTGVIMQTSHNWAGDTIVVPKAGSIDPTVDQAGNPTGSPLTMTSGTIALSCDRCHLNHAPPYTPYLRMPVTSICVECHAPRNKVSHTTGTHPVTFGYTTAIKKFARYTTKFNTTPVNANPANSSSAMKLYSGQVLCTTCHGVHYTDSSSKTFDNASSAMGISSFPQKSLLPGDGNILRTDRRGAAANDVNICTNCHKGKYAHNIKGQNIQCADCHGGHVDEADGTKPNVWLVNRYMVYSTGTFKLNNRAKNIPTFFQSTSTKNYKNAAGTGVCQSCHVVPQPGDPGGNWPVEHTSNSAAVCNQCHYHANPKGSFAATDCTGCHGSPPQLNVQGGPSGFAAGYNRANETRTAHLSHVGGAGAYNYTCNDCHLGNNHQNGVYTDVFNTKGGLAGASATYTPSNFRCSNVYCHSAGAPRGAANTFVQVRWSSGRGLIIGTAGECVACHGNAATLATNAHAKHVNTTTGKGYTCDYCHFSTVNAGGTTIKNKARHVDGFKNISFSTTVAMLSGATWNTGNATCANSCHSNGAGGAPLQAATWTNTATGACGACHNATNTTMATNGHPTHLNSTAKPNGPTYLQGLSNTAANPNGSCSTCHTTYTGTDATHVNGIVNIAFTTCNPCHVPAMNSTAWTATVTCESCHSGLLAASRSVVKTGAAAFANATAPSTYYSATKGHTQSGFTGAVTCTSCHNPASKHIGNVPQTMRIATGLTNDNSLCKSCHYDQAKVKPAVYFNTSTHFTALGVANMTCRTCHDPHGTTNLSMVRTLLKGAWTNATSYTISFINRTSTTGINGYINTKNNRGLCQVCHTKTAHYRSGVVDTTGHFTSNCFSCHQHNAGGGAFKPKGTCDACHGYPPAPRFAIQGTDFGTATNYVNAAYENYSGGGGAHLIPSHVSTSAKADQAWSNCTPCHNAGSAAHQMITPLKDNIKNVTVIVDPKYKFNAALQMKYSGAVLVYPGNKTGKCTNVECHFQASPQWTKATNPSAPTITSINPTSMLQGATNQTLTITGTNLTGATLSMSGTGVNLGTATVSATTITVPVTVAANAAAGSRTLTVTTANGSATTPFTVTAVTPAPTISSVSPASVTQGVATTVTIIGNNLTGGTLNFSNATATVTSISATTIVATVTGTTATTGTVSVTTAGGTSGTLPFTVTAPVVAPTISSVSPASVTQGVATVVTITGTNLTGGTLNFSNATATVTSISATTIVATVTGTTATTGTVSVTTTGGTSNALTFTVTAAPRTNVALASSGATATASSTITGNYSVASVINGDRIGKGWGTTTYLTNGGWNDATSNVYPDWVTITFAGGLTKTINEIDVYTLQNGYATATTDPTATTSASTYGITAFNLQYWDGTTWVAVPGGSISANTLAWRQILLASPITTSQIRINITAGKTYSRLVEVEAWGY